MSPDLLAFIRGHDGVVDARPLPDGKVRVAIDCIQFQDDGDPHMIPFSELNIIDGTYSAARIVLGY